MLPRTVQIAEKAIRGSFGQLTGSRQVKRVARATRGSRGLSFGPTIFRGGLGITHGRQGNLVIMFQCHSRSGPTRHMHAASGPVRIVFSGLRTGRVCVATPWFGPARCPWDQVKTCPDISSDWSQTRHHGRMMKGRWHGHSQIPGSGLKWKEGKAVFA